jgi:Mrp family chromosome partitioning ATPase
MLAGIILGAGVVFLMEHMDTSLGTVEALEAYLKVPVLGVIPYINFDRTEKCLHKYIFYQGKREKLKNLKAQIIINQTTNTSIIEAYRILRTHILSRLKEEKSRSLLITSACPNEGKSITAINLAVTCVQTGMKTLLVSADLRRPVLAQLFGLNQKVGLSEIVQGKVPWREVLNRYTDFLLGIMHKEDILKNPSLHNLSIITSGTLPDNPAELLNSQKLTDLIEVWEEEFDVVIFDSPPLLPVADAVILGMILKFIALVYSAERTRKDTLGRAKNQLKTVDACIIGTILNNVSQREERTFYPYYRRGTYYRKES